MWIFGDFSVSYERDASGQYRVVTRRMSDFPDEPAEYDEYLDRTRNEKSIDLYTVFTESYGVSFEPNREADDNRDDADIDVEHTEDVSPDEDTIYLKTETLASILEESFSIDRVLVLTMPYANRALRRTSNFHLSST